MVNINVKKDSFDGSTGTNTVKLDFGVESGVNVNGLFIPGTTTLSDDVADFTFPGKAGIAQLNTFYEANGSSALIASLAVSAASLAAMTLY